VADGDVIYSTQGSKFVRLTDNATGGTNGQWIDCGEYDSALIAIDFAPGTFVGTYEVDLSNAATIPLNTANGVPAAAGTTSSANVSIPVAPRWIKGRVSAFTSGAISVNVILRSNGI